MKDYRYIDLQDAFACLMYYSLSTTGSRQASLDDVESFACNLMTAINDIGDPNLKIIGHGVTEENVLTFVFDNMDKVRSDIQGNITILELKSNVTRDSLISDFDMDLIPEEIFSVLNNLIEEYEDAKAHHCQ